MKKIVSILAFIMIGFAATAQPPIRIPGAKNNSNNKFDNWKLFSSGTGFDKDIKISMSVLNDNIKGQYLSFISNKTDMVAEIVLLSTPNNPPGFDDKKTFNLPGGMVSHNLYLQLGEFNLASGQQNGYLIWFHLKNNNTPCWITTYAPIK